VTDESFQCAACHRTFPILDAHDGGTDDMGRELLLCADDCAECSFDDDYLHPVRDLDWGVSP
jgi:hypothetical protein